jgi:hypothetical protein
MQPADRQRLTRLEQHVLRHPDQARDIEIDRAAARLMAARSDTPQLLLQRVLVLEAALQQIGQQLQEAGAATPPVAAGTDTSAAALPPRTPASPSGSFVRDAAVIATGVLGGSLLFHGLASAFDGESPPDTAAPDGPELDFDADFLG